MKLRTRTALSFFPDVSNLLEKGDSKFMPLKAGEIWVKGNRDERGYAPFLHSGEAKTSALRIISWNQHCTPFLPWPASVPLLQRGGYVALGDISSGLERWQPRPAGAPRPGPWGVRRRWDLPGDPRKGPSAIVWPEPP